LKIWQKDRNTIKNLNKAYIPEKHKNYKVLLMKTKIILDDTNRFIISELLKDGRVKYTTLAKKLGVTPAAVKERFERLIKNKVIKVSGLLNTQLLFPVTACIGLETDSDGVNILIRKLRNCPLVVHMTRTSGMHNLIMNVVAKSMDQLDSFLNNQIRSEPGIKHVEVNIGNASIVVPDFHQVRLFYPDDPDYLPCKLRFDEKEVCTGCPNLVKNNKGRQGG
jgi:Lrp/AsnC family transcriptional regulator for asnA, asnC and gidA